MEYNENSMDVDDTSTSSTIRDGSNSDTEIESQSPILNLRANLVRSTTPLTQSQNTDSQTSIDLLAIPQINSVATQTHFSEVSVSNNEEPPKKRMRSDDDDEEGKLCPICFDVWDNSGEHRLCSLRCGHLFGNSCLIRWLSTQKTCPTCKSPVRKSDIRFIYAKKLIALDTSELEAMRKELQSEKSEKAIIEIELSQIKIRDLFQKIEIVDLKRQIEVLKQNPIITEPCLNSRALSIYKENVIELSKQPGCRVLDYYKPSNILAVSSPSSNPIFAGYGVWKITVNNMKCASFIGLHKNIIRDLAFHPEKELLLSVSLDKSVQLTETANNKPVMYFDCGEPVWSCCWDATNPFYFYTGEQKGTVVKYDTRKGNQKLSVIQVPNDLSPVVSLASSGWAPGSAFPRGGLFVCKLHSCWAFQNVENDTQPMDTKFPISLESPFVSMRYDEATKHLLVTSRPNRNSVNTRHTLYTFRREATDDSPDSMVVCNPVAVFQGSPIQRLLSRSCMMGVDGELYVAAHHEVHKTVDIWGVSNGAKVINSAAAHMPVLDLCPIITDTSRYLCSLNEKKLEFLKMEFK